MSLETISPFILYNFIVMKVDYLHGVIPRSVYYVGIPFPNISTRMELSIET